MRQQRLAIQARDRHKKFHPYAPERIVQAPHSAWLTTAATRHLTPTVVEMMY